MNWTAFSLLWVVVPESVTMTGGNVAHNTKALVTKTI